MRLYLAHPYAAKDVIREWQLETEANSGIEFYNPFVDNEHEIRQLPLEEQVKYYMPIVRGDLDLIDRSAGMAAFVTGEPTVGTLMEMFYAKQNHKPVLAVVPDANLRVHPWIRYTSTIVFDSPMDLQLYLEGLDYLNTRLTPPFTAIGFVGVKSSGKNTAADYLTETFGFKQFALADEMKFIAKRIWGFTDAEIAEKPDYVRKTLQTFGTESVRSYWPSAWTDLLINRMNTFNTLAPTLYSQLAVTDVRFPNEAQLLKQNGFVIVRLLRDTGSLDSHSSETALSLIKPSFTIDNNGTKEELYEKLEKLLVDIRVRQVKGELAYV